MIRSKKDLREPAENEIEMIIEAISSLDMEIIKGGMVFSADQISRRSTLLGCLYIATRKSLNKPMKLDS